MTHICVGKLTIIGSDNDLSPGRRQAIIWTNAGILLIGPLGTNFVESSRAIHTFSFKKICLKMSSGKLRPFCLGLNVLMASYDVFTHILQVSFTGTGEIEWPNFVLYFILHFLTFFKITLINVSSYCYTSKYAENWVKILTLKSAIVHLPLKI